MTDKKDTSMIAWSFKSNLSETLKELDETTRNALAVEAKIRPLTVNELASGKAKQVNFMTLSKILTALNRIAEEKGIDKKFTVSDVFDYDPDNKEATE